jgi:shikimate kinase
MIAKSDPRPIFLVGFMASGKSTVGPLLAARLGIPFIDLDQQIEAKTGSIIADIIARQGEDSFRLIETERLREALLEAPVVIAPGGGAITRPENRELMAKAGITIWIDAPFQLCWERIGQDTVVRPLAIDEPSARARYEQRLPLYCQSRLRVPVEAVTTPEDITDRIIEALAGL